MSTYQVSFLKRNETNMKRIILILSLLSIPFFMYSSDPYLVRSAMIRHRSNLGDLRLLKSDNGYAIQDALGWHELPAHDVAEPLRLLERDTLEQLEDDNGLIAITQKENGNYRLDINGQLRGGGPKLAKLLRHTVKFGGKFALWWTARKVVNKVGKATGMSNTINAAVDNTIRITPLSQIGSGIMNDLPQAAQDFAEEGVAASMAASASNNQNLNTIIDKVADWAYIVGMWIPWL